MEERGVQSLDSICGPPSSVFFQKMSLVGVSAGLLSVKGIRGIKMICMPVPAVFLKFCG